MASPVRSLLCCGASAAAAAAAVVALRTCSSSPPLLAPWRPISRGLAALRSPPSSYQQRQPKWRAAARRLAVGLVAVGGASAAALALYVGRSRRASADGPRPDAPVTRRVGNSGEASPVPRLTLYQYQTCPFCCKVRAYLDYYGYSYDVVEVNSVTRAQTSWSKYQKVPILCIENVDGEGGYLQINDSSVIVSLLHSLRASEYRDSPALVASYYPSIEVRDSRDRTTQEYPNKYFIMFGDRAAQGELAGLREEREWRKWADSELVHTLSPNIYRTPSEALQAFRHFSDVGGWDQAFNWADRFVVVYIGSIAMYFIGKSLKKRHNLKDDVRLSLYDMCGKWAKAIGPYRQYMGGDAPNLADLAVYGVLSSTEGCAAFDDMMAHTSIGPWYMRVKNAVAQHTGSGGLQHTR